MQKLAVLGLLAVVIYSCGKDFLETQPYGSVNNELLSTSEKGANSLLIAAYSNLDGFSGWDNGGPWGGASSNWTFGSIAGGDAYKGSEAGDQPDITPLERGNVDANNPYLEQKWRNYYDGISRTNQAIVAFTKLEAIDAASLKKLGISRLRIYAQGQNLLTFTKYSGLDPDVTITNITEGFNSQRDLSLGVDNGRIPLARSVIVGINLEF